MSKKWQFRIVDCLDRVFPEVAPRCASAPLAGFRDERISFQLAFRAPRGAERLEDAVSVEVTAPGIGASLFAVESAAARLVAHDDHDDGYERVAPGLFPDILAPADEGVVAPWVAGWRAVWVDLDVSQAPAGVTAVRVVVRHRASGELLFEEAVEVRVLDEVLPALAITDTHWLHADALADAYQVEVFSPDHWTAIDNFMASAARMRATSLLAPVWTPPVDTAVGARRRAVQLIDVEATGGGRYAFGFEKLDRWLGLMRGHGFTGVEIPHLFTQWGARAAPAIDGRVDGHFEQLFGWETPAGSPRYRAFLEQMLPALRRHLDAAWAPRGVVFHISDEPGPDHVASYAAARAQVEGLLTGAEVRDAISDLDYVTSGVIPSPIVATDHIADFLRAEVPELWAYHCLTQSRGVANRFLGLRPARQRVLGSQLFAAGVRGMLHWGFNYYYSAKAQAFVDPFRDASADGTMPAGDPFIVYPGPGLQPWESVRHRVAAQAMDDHRVLQLAESRLGRPAALALADPSGARSFDATHLDTPQLRSMRATWEQAIRDT